MIALNKKCQRCGNDLPIANFCKDRKQNDALNTWCKDCTRTYKASHYEKNRKRLLANFKIRYAANPEHFRQKERDRRSANATIYNARALGYQRANRPASIRRQMRYNKRKYHTDVGFRIKKHLRSRMRAILKGKLKTGSAVVAMGCTIDFLKTRFETLFSAGMTWANYGSVWHVDHIRPLSSFDLTDRKQFLAACHYTNLQPLLAMDNYKKGAAYRERAA
jgi:hypothetical protein